MVLPLAKLGTLVLRTLSKPLANRLKQHASNHPRFREVIIRFAQANHRSQVNLQRRIYNHATDVEIRPLNVERAVKAASDFIGEAFLFGVAGAVVTYEVTRTAKSEARKEEARKKVVEDLGKQNEMLTGEVDVLRVRVDELEGMSKEQSKGPSLISWIPDILAHTWFRPRTGPNSNIIVSTFGPSVLCGRQKGPFTYYPVSIYLSNLDNIKVDCDHSTKFGGRSANSFQPAP